MAEWNHPVESGSVSQQYGVENENYAAGYHTGIDYSVPVGTPVGSAARGIVVAAGDGGAYGKYVIIKHPNGMFSLYAHLRRIGVRRGQRVNEAEQIGLSGNTGNSNGPHLHFEVRDTPKYGSDENPEKFFGGKQTDITKQGQAGGMAGNPYKDGSLMATLFKAGFRNRGLAIAYAVAMAESGGRERAHNGDASTGDNSYGLFQINMLGEMGPDRRERFNLESNSDLFDPLTNARIAFKMSKGGTDWSPWTTYTRGTYEQYLDEGRAKAAKSEGAGGGGGEGGGGGGRYRGPDSGTFGYVKAFLEDHPQVADLIEQARREGWTELKLAGEIKDTAWWRNRTEAQRQWDLISSESPAQAKALVGDQRDMLERIFGNAGVKISKEEMDDLAKRAAVNGWTESEMAAAAAKRFDMTGRNASRAITGTAGQAVTEIDRLSWEWGVKVDRHTKEKWVKQMLAGKLDPMTMEDRLREQAKSLFPSLAKELNNMSVREMASPYMMVAAEELGIPPEQMSTYDPKWLKPLRGKNADGRMDMEEWTAELRSNSVYGWDTTESARRTAAQMAAELGKMMGALQ